jgi:hypothetical protein
LHLKYNLLFFSNLLVPERNEPKAKALTNEPLEAVASSSQCVRPFYTSILSSFFSLRVAGKASLWKLARKKGVEPILECKDLDLSW